MQEFPFDDWEEKLRTAKGEKHRKRAEQKLAQLGEEQSYELGFQAGIDSTLSALGYELNTDDEDFAFLIVQLNG